MQAVTDNLTAGFETMYHPMEKQVYYNMGLRYQRNNQTMIMSYMPLARKDMVTLGYITRASQHLKLFGEYRFGGTSSETTVGA